VVFEADRPGQVESPGVHDRCVSRSEQSTTSRFETIAARRSSSSSTTFFSRGSAAPSAPSTPHRDDLGARRDHRLGLLARSMVPAISGA